MLSILCRLSVCLLLLTPSAVVALETSAGEVTVETMADGLEQPWGFGFLPDGSVLITELDGKVKRLVRGNTHRVKGVGPVWVKGQGGLLDVMIPRDFETTREVFFTLAKQSWNKGGTAVARARLSENGRSLQDWTVIYEVDAFSKGRRHFGSRLVEAPDGHLFLTVGDRGDRNTAQDLSVENGSVLRITREGGIPQGNPFAQTPDAQPEIWSYGHRNPQGAALDLDGHLWVVEHGAKGGDEVNAIRPGTNYGWPIISYGTYYTGLKIGEGTQKEGLEQPAHFWDPSIAPSGMMIYSGKLWPEWRGQIFVGSLKFDHLSRLGGPVLRELEQLKGAETLRVRDVREAPDGSIWFLSVENGALYRMTP